MTYFTAIFNMKNIYLCRGRIPFGFVLFKSMDMLGFEITINEEEPFVAAADNFTDVILNIGYPRNDGSIYVGASGYGRRYVWRGMDARIGDKVKVRVVSTGRVSLPQEVKPSDCHRLMEDYKALESELLRRGWME